VSFLKVVYNQQKAKGLGFHLNLPWTKSKWPNALLDTCQLHL